MQPTRRCWGLVAAALALAGGAVVLEQPLLLAAPVLLGAWLVGAQLRFVTGLRRLDSALTVEQLHIPERVPTGDPVQTVVGVTLSAPAPLALSVTADPPVAASGTRTRDRIATLAPGDRDGLASFSSRFPVAGTFTFARPVVEATDPTGLFTETLRRGPSTELTVEARRPERVHVGEGGQRVAAAFGEHAADRHGTGVDAESLREYTPGDPARRIDWKATARLGTPQTREYQPETDLTTLLLVDHRASLGDGEPGRTKLDYLREVGLTLVADARTRSDPLGCYVVGDDGLTGMFDPRAEERAYAGIRRVLERLTPTASPDGATGETPDARAARETAAALGDDRFGRTLRPFLAAQDHYVQRVRENPLYAAVRSALSSARGSRRTVVLTDDTDRAGLRETVRRARRGNDHVVVFLAPTCLFDAPGLAASDATYDRYVDFEAFRRELARLDRVQAYEVAPGDRIDALLEDQRIRRRRARSG